MNDLTFAAILRTLRLKKWWLVGNTVAAMVIGVIVAFSLPKQYSSSAALASESKEDSPLSGNLGSMASMAGLNLGKSQDAIVPDLYPNVVETNEFLVNLLYVKVRPEHAKTDMTLLDYLTKHCKAAWWSVAFRTVKNKLVPRKGGIAQSGHRIDPCHLTEMEDELVNGVKNMVVCTYDDENDVINIKAVAQDPYVARQIVEATTIQLQKFITDYRTSKARVDMAYYARLKEEAHVRYVKAQKKYAAYSDSHMDLSLKSFQLESDALENDLQLAYNEYTQKSAQLTMAEAKVQERTPAFTVLERASVAPRAESPKKKLIVLAYGFLAFAGTFCYLMLLNPSRHVIARIKGEELAALPAKGSTTEA